MDDVANLGMTELLQKLSFAKIVDIGSFEVDEGDSNGICGVAAKHNKCHVVVALELSEPDGSHPDQKPDDNDGYANAEESPDLLEIGRIVIYLRARSHLARQARDVQRPTGKAGSRSKVEIETTQEQNMNARLSIAPALTDFIRAERVLMGFPILRLTRSILQTLDEMQLSKQIEGLGLGYTPVRRHWRACRRGFLVDVWSNVRGIAGAWKQGDETARDCGELHRMSSSSPCHSPSLTAGEHRRDELMAC